MKIKPSKKNVAETPDLATLAGQALVRAGKQARKIARMYGTKVYVIRDGKIVGEKP